MTPAIEFRDAGPDRQAAFVGQVQLGEVVAFQAGNGRARAWWRTYLPDDEIRAPVGAPSVERACDDLIAHVEAWLRRLLPGGASRSAAVIPLGRQIRGQHGRG